MKRIKEKSEWKRRRNVEFFGNEMPWYDIYLSTKYIYQN